MVASNFILPTKFGLHILFETCNIENWKNETENICYKLISKCDRSLLQSASGITKCDKPLLQSASGITKYGRLLLQSATVNTK